MSLEASSRPVSPLVSLPLDFSEPANFTACLDNSAARHRIAVKQRACAKRKPASVRPPAPPESIPQSLGQRPSKTSHTTDASHTPRPAQPQHTVLRRPSSVQRLISSSYLCFTSPVDLYVFDFMLLLSVYFKLQHLRDRSCNLKRITLI